MTFTVQDYRTNTLGQRPNAGLLLDGQTAINYNSGSPGMFFKTDTGALVKVGPCAVGASEPPLAGTSSHSVGELWLRTSDYQLFVYSTVG